MILFSDTVQERCDVQHDAAAKAQGGYNFHSAAQLIRRRDIARYSGSTTARLCVNFSAILWQLAMQHSESSTAAHLVRKF